MLILLSTSFIVALNETPLRSYLMKPHFCVSYSDDYTTSQYHYFDPHSPIDRPFSKMSPENVALNYPNRTMTKLQTTEQKNMKLPKSNYLQTLSVEDAQQEKRNRILRQKSSTETSGLGSSLDYTSTDELNNRSASNSRRHSSTSNAVLETKVVFSTKPSPVPINTRKVSWRNLPNTTLMNSSQISRGFYRPDNFALETIESSGSSHANNDHSTPQSLNDFDNSARIYKQYIPPKSKSGDYCEQYMQEVKETTVWKLRQEKKPKTYYNSELDFGTLVHSTDCENNPYYDPKDETRESEIETKRKSFQIKTISSDSEQVRWCNWSREKRSELSKRSEFCHLLKNTATKNTDYTELQSLIPKSSYTEMDQSINNDNNLAYNNNNNNINNNNPSTSQSSNPQSCTETMQISATYFAELSKKTSDKKRKDEENRLTHEQIHYLVEYWDHDTFVRLRTWALCFALLAVGLQIFVGISSSWSFFGDEKYPNYAGLWVTCIPENSTCNYRLPFISENNVGFQDGILCLLTVSTIFSIGGSGLSFTGLCVTALARKLYYYHSAGEIFFVSGMTMALAVSLYSITVEFHFKFHRHRYGYTFWLAWFAAILLLLSALNLLMDELIQGSTKLRGCSCLAKCFRCCCNNRSRNSETGSHIYHQPQQQISMRRVNSRRDHCKLPINVSKDISPTTSKMHNKTLETTTLWRNENNDIEEDFV